MLEVNITLKHTYVHIECDASDSCDECSTCSEMALKRPLKRTHERASRRWQSKALDSMNEPNFGRPKGHTHNNCASQSCECKPNSTHTECGRCDHIEHGRQHLSHGRRCECKQCGRRSATAQPECRRREHRRRRGATVCERQAIQADTEAATGASEAGKSHSEGAAKVFARIEA